MGLGRTGQDWVGAHLSHADAVESPATTTAAGGDTLWGR